LSVVICWFYPLTTNNQQPATSINSGAYKKNMINRKNNPVHPVILSDFLGFGSIGLGICPRDKQIKKVLPGVALYTG